MKKILFLLIILFLVSCKYFRGDNCSNTKSIIGTYKNVFDDDAENVLIINEDGTFEQRYIKKGVAKENIGKWFFYQESCNVKLEGLVLMHHKLLGVYEKQEFREEGVYRLNTIRFNEDLQDEFDFYRIE